MRWQPYVTKKLCFCELMLMKTSSRVDGAKMITASSWWMPTWRRRLLSPPMPDHQWWTQPLGLLEVSSLVSNNHRLYSPLCCLLCVCCGFCCCINLPHLAAVKTSTDGSNHFVRSSLLPTHINYDTCQVKIGKMDIYLQEIIAILMVLVDLDVHK